MAEAVPEVRVIVAEDADTAAREIVDAEAAFGWLGKDLLANAVMLSEVEHLRDDSRGARKVARVSTACASLAAGS